MFATASARRRTKRSKYADGLTPIQRPDALQPSPELCPTLRPFFENIRIADPGHETRDDCDSRWQEWLLSIPAGFLDLHDLRVGLMQSTGKDAASASVHIPPIDLPPSSVFHAWPARFESDPALVWLLERMQQVMTPNIRPQMDGPKRLSVPAT
jgi:hypothetical protein